MKGSSFDQPLGSRTSFDSTADHQKPLAEEFEFHFDDGDDGADTDPAPGAGIPFDANLAEHIDANTLLMLASDLDEAIQNDISARQDWEKTYIEGIKMLGLVYERKTEPWPDACGVFHPMLAEAVVRFQSETIIETFPARGPVRTIVLGNETPDKVAASKRVEADMNYQLTEIMTEFRSEHERLLWHLPIAGSAFKKVYMDPSIGRQTSVFCPAEDVILPYGATDLRTAERITHRMRRSENELKRAQKNGFYRDVDLGKPMRGDYERVQEKKDRQTGISAIYDERYTLYECACYYDIPDFPDTDESGNETGIALPYVVTFDKASRKVLAVRRNYDQHDPTKQPRCHFVHYQYIPGFGAYGLGLTHLIGGYTRSATLITRQLVDAGTLANLPGGLKARGLRIKGDDTPISPGEFRDVEVISGAIKDNVMLLPYKEPSATLFNLLQSMVQEARNFASTADMKIGDMSAQAPVGTTLAIIERMLKVMSAVQARTHSALKAELKLLFEIIKGNKPEYDFDQDDATHNKAKRQDYAHVDIVPCSDPNAATSTQRIVQYQAAIQLSSQAPSIYNQQLLHQQMLGVLGLQNAEKLVPITNNNTDVDPVTENAALLTTKPANAQENQNHDAHIQVHMAMVQDPKMQQMIGQSPNANAIQAGIQAHIFQHLGFQYKAQIQQIMGKPLPPDGQPMDPSASAQIAMAAAQAAQQLLQQNQQIAAQQAAQAAAADPILQQQQQDLAIKAGELDRKRTKDAQDFQLAQRKLALEEQLAHKDSLKEGLNIALEDKHKTLDRAHKSDLHVRDQYHTTMEAHQDRLHDMFTAAQDNHSQEQQQLRNQLHGTMEKDQDRKHAGNLKAMEQHGAAQAAAADREHQLAQSKAAAAAKPKEKE